MEMYDVIIIGAGPAGLTAAVYAARYKLSTLVVAREFGGMAGAAHKICNFPSYDEISGFELMMKMQQQAEKLDVSITYGSVEQISHKDGMFAIETDSGNTFHAKKVIYAAGTERRKLRVKGENEFIGRGVSYCATCDAAFFKDKTVAVIGGSDAAVTSALLLSEYARKVYIIYRGDRLKSEPVWTSQAESNQRIDILYNEELREISGSKKVEAAHLMSGRKIILDGVFIEVGSDPKTGILSELDVELDNDYVKVDSFQKTSVDGVYAAGDITNGSNRFKQVVTAAAEGAIAAHSVYEELRKVEAMLSSAVNVMPSNRNALPAD